MKFVVHIAVGQYEFIEVETETIQDAVDKYFEIKEAFEKKKKDKETDKPPFDSKNPPRNPHLDYPKEEIIN